VSPPPTPPEGGGPVDEVGVDLGPDEARGLLDAWTGTGGGTGDRTGERTGAVGTDQDAAHARLAALAEAEALLRETRLPDSGAGVDWLLRVSPDPLPLADGLPPPALPAAPDGISEVTAVAQHPFWASGGPEPEGRPTDSGFVGLDDLTDALGGAGKTQPGVAAPPATPRDGGFSDPTERTLTRVTVPGAPVPPVPPSAAPPAWLLSVLGGLVVILAGIVVLLLLGR
jgi:hypothetical protein